MARVPFRMIFSCVGVQHGGCRPDLGPGAVTEYTILLNAISVRWTPRLGFHVTVRRGVRGMPASGVPGGTEGAGIGVRSDGFEGVDDAAPSIYLWMARLGRFPIFLNVAILPVREQLRRTRGG